MKISGSKNGSSAGTLLTDRRVTVNSKVLKGILAQNDEKGAAARLVLRAEKARVLFQNRILHIDSLVRDGIVRPEDIEPWQDLGLKIVENHMHSNGQLKAVCTLDAMRSTASNEEIRPVLAEADKLVRSVEDFLSSTATLGNPRRQIA